MCIIDCLSTIVFILPLHLDYTKVIILILWWRNFQLEYWRTFQLVSTVLDDPNVNMSPTEVMDFYSMNYPELTTATVHGPEIEDDRAVYEFKTTIGVKG